MALPRVAVTGATGAQGRSVVEALLASKRYSVRALTRKVDSPAALALKERGAEVVAADFSDVESLKVAFAGADALFAVTNFFDSNSAETEKAQLENIIAAAAAAKPRHVVYSGLEDTRVDVPLGTTIPTLGGKYNVEHFDEKGAAIPKFAAAGLPTTTLLLSAYYENYLNFDPPQPTGDGGFAITVAYGDTAVPHQAVADLGPLVVAVLDNPTKHIGATIGIAAEYLTAEAAAATLSKELGVPIKVNHVSPEVYATFPFPAAKDISNMQLYFKVASKEFTGRRPLSAAKELYPGIRSFAQWVSDEKAALKAKLKLDA